MEPKPAPIRIPGVKIATTFQSTALFELWVKREDKEVNRIVAREVPIAVWNKISSENPKLRKITVRIGTIIIPPPTPNSPAKVPTKIPDTM